MGKGKKRGAIVAVWALAGFGIACRASEGFAAFALGRISAPAMALLNRLTAPVPFPIAEPIALVLAAGLALALAVAAFRAVVLRNPGPMGRWLSTLARIALVLGGALLLLWGPARETSLADLPPVPDADRLEWLCGALAQALNGSDLRFSPADEILRLAPQVAQLPGGAVKAARYPEWMAALRASGLFVPLTGEALVDPTLPEPLLPFTAVHELMHLRGIADEGIANIAAWERCVASGGEFADSARLWALRYALGLLRRQDEAAWQRAMDKLKDAPKRVLEICGGEATPSAIPSPGIHMPSLSRGDYTALAGYLALRGEA